MLEIILSPPSAAQSKSAEEHRIWHMICSESGVQGGTSSFVGTFYWAFLVAVGTAPVARDAQITKIKQAKRGKILIVARCCRGSKTTRFLPRAWLTLSGGKHVLECFHGMSQSTGPP